MMEKYGAEIKKYEVFEITPSQPDDRKLVGTDLTLDDANDLAEKNKNYIVYPM